jgi:ribosomal protein S20
MAVRRIDRAAAQGVIHKNQASNRKSRLMRHAAKAGEQEPVSTKK